MRISCRIFWATSLQPTINSPLWISLKFRVTGAHLLIFYLINLLGEVKVSFRSHFVCFIKGLAKSSSGIVSLEVNYVDGDAGACSLNLFLVTSPYLQLIFLGKRLGKLASVLKALIFHVILILYEDNQVFTIRNSIFFSWL